jgi:hypothetical protein
MTVSHGGRTSEQRENQWCVLRLASAGAREMPARLAAGWSVCMIDLACDPLQGAPLVNDRAMMTPVVQRGSRRRRSRHRDVDAVQGPLPVCY